MINRIYWLLIVVFLAVSLFMTPALDAAETKLTVLSPRGTPPPIQQLAMAPRLDTLVGKTVYIVDIRFPYTHQFIEELQKVLSERYPQTKWVMKEKAGAYGDNDAALWKEIKEKGHAAVMAIGH
jgi:hypothetical protein